MMMREKGMQGWETAATNKLYDAMRGIVLAKMVYRM